MFSVIHCHSLPQITNGYYEPENCTTLKKHKLGTKCRIKCYSGFNVDGPDTRICVNKGIWTDKKVITTCVGLFV